MEGNYIGLFVEHMDVVMTRGARSRVEINFLCNLSVHEYYDNMLVRLNTQPSIRHCSIHIDLDRSMSHQELVEMFDQQLREWPVLDVQELNRRRLIEDALNIAEFLLGTMPPRHNVLVIPLRIDIVSHRAIVMEEPDLRMVPAMVSSIESLNITTAKEEQSCLICLEDFDLGCQVVSMPCSHVFHEECIKTWLKSSHYCPLCRFEMPTKVVLVHPRIGHDVATTRETQFHVDIHFTLDLVVVREDYDDLHLQYTVQPSFIAKSVRMGIQQLMDPENSLRMIASELGEWPLDDRSRRKLSRFAFEAAKDLPTFMPPQHNVLVIPIRVLVQCQRLANLEESDSEMVPEMVPAADSSIEEYLEIKTASNENEDESCSICLEDFYYGCKVLSMPCSHIFHEDCIKKCLKSSHYCPMCRFEMPTVSNLLEH
ncbi:hypothetical protein F511_25949 [Dorcoceras hygrometricum]|uniref:RING-type E3 ubiquitin transferase n=1 Tax=Dorcoceras hygrometricum TaxID=472368 RepID=A0A2Z7BIR7_9LAMI|nr:hypothetical protein F511_25949 [Dorcoceras hygrometricum]